MRDASVVVGSLLAGLVMCLPTGAAMLPGHSAAPQNARDVGSSAGPFPPGLPVLSGPLLADPSGSHGGNGSAAEALGSPTNWYVANWSGEGMIAENPTDPLNLVAGGLYSPAGAYNNSTDYYGHGVSGAFTSWDGGRTWSDQYLPANKSWSQSSSDQCGHNHLADTNVAFGDNNTVYYVDLGYYYGSSGVSCTGALAGTDLYVTISHDGGRTWDSPVGVAGMGSGSSIDKPWIAVDARTGEVYVAYTDDGNSSAIELQNTTDHGVHWSKPLAISQNSGSNRGVELVVDPSGGVDALWIDQSSAALYFTRSTNHGASFSKPVTVATALSEFTSPSPDAFRAYTLPALGVDGFGSNGYTGRLFATWQNGSGGSAGTPAISLAYSSDNGSRWSAPVRVDSDHQLENFQPDVAVGPDGTVFVEWYGENAVTGHYRLYGTSSRNGGDSFAPQVAVSNVDSYPQYGSGSAAYSAWWIGDYTHVIADAHGARPLWTDARARQEWACSVCLWHVNYNITFYTAEMVNGTIGANLPVNLTVNGTLPVNGTLAAGPTPYGEPFLVGQTYNLTAPATVDWNGSTWSFASWFGTQDSANRSLVGTVAGPTALRACYTLEPGALCDAPGAPGELELNVTPANASVELNGTTLPTGAGALSYLAPPGTYSLNASAFGYYPVSENVTLRSGQTVNRTLHLPPIPGFIVGVVSPANATVRVDGRAIVVGPGGTFNTSVLPGPHDVRASEYGYSTFVNHTVGVRFGQPTVLSIRLSAELGWINGSVIPANASLFLDGRPLATTLGFFTTELFAGTYWINGTADGYDPLSSGPVNVTPNALTAFNLTLSAAPGELVGTVSVPSAEVVVNGTVVATPDGVFNESFAPGLYEVNASAPGYAPIVTYANISSNSTTFLPLELLPVSGWVRGSVSPANATVLLDWKPVLVLGGGVFNVSLPPGVYALVVSAPGHVGAARILRVAAGEWTPIAVTLRPSAVATVSSAPPASAPLTGAVVFAVLAGAAALLLAATARRVARRPRAPRRGPPRARVAPKRPRGLSPRSPRR